MSHTFPTGQFQRGGGTTPLGTVAPGQFAQVSPTTDPGFMDLFQQILGGIPQAQDPFQQLLAQGVASPLLQTVLAPALANLQRGEAQARQSQEDVFRGAGQLASGARGVASSRLEGELQGQRGNLIAQIISSMLPQIAQGLAGEQAAQFAPTNAMTQLLRLIAPQLVQGEGARVGGAGGAGGAGGISDPFGFLEASRAASAGATGGARTTGVPATTTPSGPTLADFIGLGGGGGGGFAGVPDTGQSSFFGLGGGIIPGGDLLEAIFQTPGGTFTNIPGAGATEFLPQLGQPSFATLF